MPHGNWPARTVVALILHGRAEGQQIVNVHHLQATSGEEATLTTDALASTAGAAIVTTWLAGSLKTSWLACHQTNYTLEGVGAQVVERPAAFEHRLSETLTALSSGNVGTRGDNTTPLPLHVAAEIKWRGTVSNRHNRGRTFIAPISTQDVTGNRTLVLTPGSSLFNTYASNLMTAYGPSASDWNLCVYSRPYSAPKGAYVKRVGGVLTVVNNTTDYDGAANLVQTASVDSVLRSQRRREIGVGA